MPVVYRPVRLRRPGTLGRPTAAAAAPPARLASFVTVVRPAEEEPRRVAVGLVGPPGPRPPRPAARPAVVPSWDWPAEAWPALGTFVAPRRRLAQRPRPLVVPSWDWPAEAWPATAAVAAPPIVANLPADLLEALVAFLATDASTAAAFGWAGQGPLAARVFADADPAGAAFPYVVVLDLGDGDATYESVDGDGATGYLDHGTYQVTVVASSPTGGKAQARALGRALQGRLNDAPLVFATGTLIWFRRAGRPVDVQDPTPGPDGSDVWRYILQFDWQVERDL